MGNESAPHRGDLVSKDRKNDHKLHNMHSALNACVVSSATQEMTNSENVAVDLRTTCIAS